MIVTIQLDTRSDADAETLARMTDMFGKIPPEAKSPEPSAGGGVKRGPGRPRKDAVSPAVVAETPITPITVEIPTHPDEMAIRRNLQEMAARGEPVSAPEDTKDAENATAPAVEFSSAQELDLEGNPFLAALVKPVPAAPPPEPAMTLESFRAAAVAYAKQHGGKALLAILQRHGFANIGAVPEDKITAIAAELALDNGLE